MIDAVTQTKPISVTGNSHPNHQQVMNVDDEHRTKSNVSGFSNEDEVEVHKNFMKELINWVIFKCVMCVSHILAFK